MKVKLPDRRLTNIDLIKYANILNMTDFRGVFMRNELPNSGPLDRESAIIDLVNVDGPGTHWVAFRKIGNHVTYFDSFGNLRPPMELILYLNGREINYNIKRY